MQINFKKIFITKQFFLFQIILFVNLVLFVSCDSKENINLKEYHPAKEENFIRKIDHIYFVGKTGNNYGVYEYNLLLHNYREIWNSNDETIILLSYNSNLEYLFFLTAKRLGTNRGVAFIQDIKLYRVSVEGSLTEFITEIGDAVQLFVEWIGMNFKIQFTRFDLRIASHINKVNQIYSPFGKLIKENKEVYDFIKEGYPNFDIEKSSLISPSGNFGLQQTSDSIFIKVAGSEQIIPVDSTGDNIGEVRWSDDERFVFFTTNIIGADGKLYSTIYVFDIVTRLILKKQINGGRKGFLLINNLLIFDEFKDAIQSIIIYDYSRDKEIDRIVFKDGCGLRQLQEI